MSGSQSSGSAALAYPGRGLSILACHWPAPPSAPSPPNDATRDMGQLSRWWQAHPAANLATYTDPTRVGVIELHHPAKPDHVIRLLNSHRADPCPVIHAGPGLVQFLVQPDLHAADHIPAADPNAAHNGTVTWLAAGTLVLLPPSRLMSGERLRWMRRLYHTTRLADAAPLLAQLAEFIETGALNDLHPLLT